ncbi:peptidase C19 family, partial [Rhizoctonia solani]
MPVPDIATHAGSDDSDHSPARQAPSSDAASTDSSSSDNEETLENDYVGTQDTDFAAGLDVTMNDQSEPGVLESDSDCPHIRARIAIPGFVKLYSSAITWRARSQMQSSNNEPGSKRPKLLSDVRNVEWRYLVRLFAWIVQLQAVLCLGTSQTTLGLQGMVSVLMDLVSGSVFCSDCDDFIYSSRLDQAHSLALLSAEEQVARFKISSSPRQQYRPWVPDGQIANDLARATQVQCSGLRGLINMGNTCYLNVIVQTMVHNPLVRNYFMSDRHNHQLCETKDCMSCEMDRLFTKVYSSDPGPYVPTSMLHCLWVKSSELATYAQHDAHEFFISMLNQIHATTPGSSQTNCTCLVHSTFAGLLQSDVQCGHCENVTSRSEIMLDISLELKPTAQNVGTEDTEMTLLSCLKRFTQPEKTTYKCDKCEKSSNDATKQFSIRKLPPVLSIDTIFPQQRFEVGAASSNKIDHVVRFGATLNMAPFSSVVARKGANKDPGPDSMYEYDLLAVVNHDGQTMDNGHYTNFARCQDRWYRFDDAKVTRVTLQECLKSSAYMLVYVKRHLSYRAGADEMFLPVDGELLPNIDMSESMLMELSAAAQDEELLQLLGDVESRRVFMRHIGLDHAMEDLQKDFDALSTEVLISGTFDAQQTLKDLLKMLEDYANQHANDSSASHDPETKRDTPGVETFFWHLWDRALHDIGRCETDHEQETNRDVRQVVALLKAMQELPKGKHVWTLWGEDVDVNSLPLLGPGIRNANNGPFYYNMPSDAEMARPEVQNTLAGAGAGDQTDKSISIVLKRRREWLGLQALIAKLLSEMDLKEYALHGIWAARDGLENWPAVPPAIITEQHAEEPPAGEDTAAYRALLVEGATTWLRFAAHQLYTCTEIWGPNGNPEWKSNAGTPGHGGDRWKGVDGMDPGKKRWGLWKEVLHEVVAWYDKEVSEGRGKDWKVKYGALKALEAMVIAEGN